MPALIDLPLSGWSPTMRGRVSSCRARSRVSPSGVQRVGQQVEERAADQRPRSERNERLEPALEHALRQEGKQPPHHGDQAHQQPEGEDPEQRRIHAQSLGGFNRKASFWWRIWWRDLKVS